MVKAAETQTLMHELKVKQELNQSQDIMFRFLVDVGEKMESHEYLRINFFGQKSIYFSNIYAPFYCL